MIHIYFSVIYLQYIYNANIPYIFQQYLQPGLTVYRTE